jgi:RimJ/RimL family protein N-acetyltransferase
MWLHDIVHDSDGTPRAGWLGAYVLPEHRGASTAQQMWRQMYDASTQRGIESLYIASHHANKRAHAVAERHLGFHRVDIYPAFARCQGEATDFLILSMRQEDIAEAWTLAYERAEQQAHAYERAA